MKHIVDLIKGSQKILLSTHRQCDGDGLGAELALFYAIKKLNKNVRVINVDPTPRKYRFLQPDEHITYFLDEPTVDLTCDLCLIFDTNDERMLGELYVELFKVAKRIVFIDHHPVLVNGPKPSADSYIDVTAASTGELAYRLIKSLGIPLDRDMSRALYTSITFDTQLYRFVRNSPESHLIAAELLTHDIDPEDVHRHLFGNQTVNKMAFFAKLISQIEYFENDSIAVLRFVSDDLFQFGLEPDDSRDVIDNIMNIETLEAAVIFREDSANEYRVSIRSKQKIEVLTIAESLGGGGHRHASGAFVHGDYNELKNKVLNQMIANFKKNAP